MAIYVFLSQNGFLLDVSNAQAVRVINDVASGETTEEGLAEWIRANTQ
jgi:prophage maintenance system killer protein